MLRTCSLTLLAIAAGLAVEVENTPYLTPVAGGFSFTEIMTVGEMGTSGERMCGIPDGLGAYDNGDGTFTLLMNHELQATAGKVRAHGNKGAFISKWIIDKTNPESVSSITDFNQTSTSIYLWNGSGYTAGTTAYARLCSADLPPITAFLNPATGRGTVNRIFMNGEETGDEGRAFAHVATGADAGKSWQLPLMGRASWENLIACPKAQDTTVVIGTDDTTPGQVYVYVGTKRSTGNDVERAGLTSGKLYGIRANADAVEERDATTPEVAPYTSMGMAKNGSASFALVEITDPAGKTGAQIQSTSQTLGITEFLRPEDGAWDPANPTDFYFVTTDRFDTDKNGGSGAASAKAASRLWRLRFTDIADPAAGGTITMLLDGAEANHQMLDNMCVDAYGRVIMQEDPGNQPHAARVWAYTIATGALTELATHRTTMFGQRVGGVTSAAQAGFTSDEESSGIIDVSDILGAGKYLMVVQAHNSTATPITQTYSDGTTAIPAISEVVENGQLLLMTDGASLLRTGLQLRNWGFGALRDGTTILTREALWASNSVAGGSVYFKATTLPSIGLLKLNGVPMNVNDVFTQADIDAGKVTYTHSSGVNDAFARLVFDVTAPGFAPLSARELNISIGTGLRVQKISEYQVPAGFNANGGVAEIVTYDPASRRLFLVDGSTESVNVLGLSAAQSDKPSLLKSLTPSSVVAAATTVNSVACKNGLLAVAVANTVKTSPGFVFFYNAATGAYVSHIDFLTALSQVGGIRGALPDMVTFTPDGLKVLVAIEAEPSDDVLYTDPDGGLVVIDVTAAGVPAATATFIGFSDANTAAYKTAGVRIYNDKATTAPAASAAKDMEPEYIAVSPDSSTAWVSCQENNALAVFNLTTKTLTSVAAFGTKDHSVAGNEVDLSNEDSGANTNSGGASIKIQTYPGVRGLYMPDGIAVHASGGSNYVLSANEGDSRAWAALNEEFRVRDSTNVLDATVFPTAAQPHADAESGAFPLTYDSNLGRVKITKFSGDTDADNDFDFLPLYGARSFSVWNAAGALQWDSGAQFETFFSNYFSAVFNANHSDANNDRDDRSDDKGPEPEGVTVLAVGAKSYAAIGLERMGGFFLYDLTAPTAPTMAAYYTGRHFTAIPTSGKAGDLGPEGMLAIAAADSPTGTPLLIVGNEVSGTVSIHSVTAGPTVAGGNSAPTISAIADVSVAKNASSGPLSFIIADPDSALSSLVLSISTSDGSYLPVGNLQLGGSGYGRTVTAIPAAALTGSATVTVTVSDGIASSSETFVVNTPADAVAAAAPVASSGDDSSGCGVGGTGVILVMGTLAFLGLRRRRN